MGPIEDSAWIDECGKLRLTHEKLFVEAIAAHPNTPGMLIFKPHSNRITHNQRKYFFGVIVNIIHSYFQAVGNDEVRKINVVNFLKERFLFREEMCPITHRFQKVYISLSDNDGAMSHAEFTENKEAIQRWAAETLNGLYIPDPDKNWKMYKKNETISNT